MTAGGRRSTVTATELTLQGLCCKKGGSFWQLQLHCLGLWPAADTAPPNRTAQHKKVLTFTYILYILHIFQLSIFNFMPLNVLCLGRGPHFSPASLKLWFFQSSKVCHNPCLHYPVPPNNLTVLLSATLYKCSLQTPHKSLACGTFMNIPYI